MKSVIFSLLIISQKFFEIFGDHVEGLEFPENFLIGAASSSYQVEGGWNVSDKGENVWDWMTHNYPSIFSNEENGDIACDSYNKYKEDVQILEKIGCQVYRFSISWARVLPYGFAQYVSQSGIQYYKNLIDELLANGIEPFVTLYHWDHPQAIQKLGGWTNDLIVDWFGDYAEVIFRELGPKVKYFGTINEPAMLCGLADMYGPGSNISGTADYICLHNVLKAHARAYHIYDKKFRAQQQGMISIVLPCSFFIPETPKDNETVEIAFQFDCGWLGHPIFSKKGDYPKVVRDRIDENSKLQGWPRSRLPKLSREWINYIRGTGDFFGLNHYSTSAVKSVPKLEGSVWHNDRGFETASPSWTDESVLDGEADGFRGLLLHLKQNYGNIPVFVLENGIGVDSYLDDSKRVQYLHAYIREMLEAIHFDGCNVQMYTVWSLLDNFEWYSGYSTRFGITYVDFEDPERKRTPKLSSYWLSDVITGRKLLLPDEYLSEDFKEEHNIT